MTATTINIYLEIGKQRVFAGAVEWPGWCRSGRDEEAAQQALLASGPRYAELLRSADIEFTMPPEQSAFTITERLVGNTTTDFGAPDVAPESDSRPVDETELHRLQQLLQAYWQAFDMAVERAEGKVLRKGPRGGGREAAQIVQHVLDAEAGYLARLAWKLPKGARANIDAQREHTRQAVLAAVTAAAHGETPARGPRGGVIWSPRYFVRRVAWHVLDHLWEIEERS